MGSVLFGDRQEAGPRQDTAPREGASSRQTPAPKPSVGPVSLSVDIEAPSADWAFMADEGLAQRRPPDDVTSCRTFFAWALSQGSAPIFQSVHVLTIRASRDVHIELLGLEARQLPTQTAIPPTRPVRLTCQQSDYWTSTPEQQEKLPKVPTTPAEETGGLDMGEEFYVAAGELVRDRFLVEPLVGPGQYDYTIVAKLELDGEEKTFQLDAGGQPFRQSEDGAGMGYAPASYAWTFSPEPSYVHCPEIWQPEASPSPTCRQESPR